MWFEEAFTEEYSGIGTFVNVWFRHRSSTAGQSFLCYRKPMSSPLNKTFPLQLDEVSPDPFRVHPQSFRDLLLGNRRFRRESPENHPPDLPVGSFEWRLFLIMSALPVWILMLFLEHYAIIHEGKVPFARVGSIEGLLHQWEHLGIFDIVLLLKEVMDKNPPYVRLNKDDGLVEGEGTDCTCGGPANSRKGHQCFWR